MVLDGVSLSVACVREDENSEMDLSVLIHSAKKRCPVRDNKNIAKLGFQEVESSSTPTTAFKDVSIISSSTEQPTLFDSTMLCMCFFSLPMPAVSRVRCRCPGSQIGTRLGFPSPAWASATQIIYTNHQPIHEDMPIIIRLP